MVLIMHFELCYYSGDLDSAITFSIRTINIVTILATSVAITTGNDSQLNGLMIEYLHIQIFSN